MTSLTLRKRVSAMALGIALATGSAVTIGMFGFAEPAHAQRGKSPYSKEFSAKYNPLVAAAEAEGADINALKPQIAELRALAKAPAEILAVGQLYYNAAIRSNDPAMQLTGMELMLASGQVPPETTPRYNYIAYQLANQSRDFAKARTYLQKAGELNYTSETVNATAIQLLMAELYFSDSMFREGMATLKGAIDGAKSRGEAIDERWYRRGVGLGVTNKVVPEVYTFAAEWVSAFPTEVNWRDSVNLVRNLNRFQSPEILDLMRLSAKVGTLDNVDDVKYYVAAADARRLPLEVKNVIERTFAAMPEARDDIELTDPLQTANDRLATDRADLPELEAEALASVDEPTLVISAGDTFYSYGDYAKAERLYTKALTMPGAEIEVARTRLGMAQIGQGKYAEARATLAQVEGVRLGIATMWSAYAAQQMADGAVAGE